MHDFSEESGLQPYVLDTETCKYNHSHTTIDQLIDDKLKEKALNF